RSPASAAILLTNKIEGPGEWLTARHAVTNSRKALESIGYVNFKQQDIYCYR
ncbi:MAG: hypothetical protein ACI845_004019, partial [Gammaproteobacteria bacterium]